MQRTGISAPIDDYDMVEVQRTDLFVETDHPTIILEVQRTGLFVEINGIMYL